jgi:hypothetical protein
VFITNCSCNSNCDCATDDTTSTETPTTSSAHDLQVMVKTPVHMTMKMQPSSAPMTYNQFMLAGERCSGTNFVSETLNHNFNITQISPIHKHWFTFYDYTMLPSNTIVVCVVRNIYDWLNSFYIKKHHLDKKVYNTPHAFLNKKIISYNPNYKLIKEDRNHITNKSFKNIMELRKVKLRFMLHELPKMTKHIVYIRYEDLNNDFNAELDRVTKILDCPKSNKYPFRPTYYKKEKNKEYKPIVYKSINSKMILKHKDFDPKIEREFGYIYNDMTDVSEYMDDMTD